MKEPQFWKELVKKIYERVKHDRLLYGDAYIEIVYEEGLIKSLKFDGTMMQDKVIKND